MSGYSFGGTASAAGSGESLTVTTEDYKIAKIGTAAETTSIAQNREYEADHGLGETPDYVELVAECTTAQGDYAVGDKVILNNDKDRIMPWATATKVGFTTYTNRGTPLLIHKTQNTTFNLTAANWTIRAIPYLFVDETVVTNVAGSGSAVSSSELTPLQNALAKVWASGDLDKIVNIGGIPYRIVAQHQDGHGKVVNTVALTNIAYYGFAADVAYVTSPAAGDFVWHAAFHEFVIYQVNGADGWTELTGWYDYDPFAPAGNSVLGNNGAAGAWANAPTGNNYSGALTWVGYEDDEQAIFNRATAAGQVFANSFDGTIEFVDEFTAATEDYDGYTPRPVIPDPAIVGVEKGIRQYTEEDVGKLFNTPTGLKRIEKKLSPGHGQTQTLIELTDTNFNGVIRNPTGLFDPRDPGKFWWDFYRGGFWISRRSGQAGSYIWSVERYDPFATGEPWHTAPAGNSYSGDLDGRWGGVDSEAHAERAANHVGQVFVIFDRNTASSNWKVVYVDEYTAPATTHVYYDAVPEIPLFFNNPTAEYWGRGQNERWPSDYPNDDDGIIKRRLRFRALEDNATYGIEADKPHRYKYGGDILIGNPFIDVSEDADLTGANANIDPGDNLDDWTVFQLPAGEYNIKVWMEIDDHAESYAAFALYRVIAGENNDKIQMGASIGYGTRSDDSSQNIGPTAFIEVDLDLDGTEKFYIAVIDLDSDIINTRHYMLVTRRL